MNILLIRNTEIVNISTPFPINNPEPGLQDNGYYVLYSELDGLDPVNFMQQRYWDGTSLQARPPPPSPFCKWNNGTWVVDEAYYIHQIRADRLTLLNKSDWTQLPDTPLTLEQKEEARVYRQALRDITLPIEQNPSVYINIEDAPWPIPPTFLA